MAETSPYDTYTSPLATRNASPEMLRLWSARHKFNTWRRVWLAVAEAQHELGLPVSKEQVEELRAVVNRPGGITDDEIRLAEKYEGELRHDVMAHVHALGDSCPKARGIIHLGMTSEDVVGNAEWVLLHESRSSTVAKIARTCGAFGEFALRQRAVPTLALTHYQAAQPMSVGRRAAQWSHDLAVLCPRNSWPRPRGLRGATGTQASFLELFGGNAVAVDRFEAEVIKRVKQMAMPGSETESTDDYIARVRAKNIAGLEAAISKATTSTSAEELTRLQREQRLYLEKTPEQLRADHARSYVRWQVTSLTGQTAPRVDDCLTLADLAATAAVLHKIATDIRLLCGRKELDEPFEDKQIGSSAMPYKRNPMRCERICGLCRFVMNLVGNAYDTAATQWLERTLDDSSNRRLSLPEAFLALDGALDLMHNVASGLIVHEAMVKKNLMAELPFLATENILMACVKAGGDRQKYHEIIRRHAQAAGARVKDEGLDNDLLDRLQKDAAFHPPALKAELDWSGLMDPMKYIGRSVEQTERFIKEVVEPLREQYGDAIAKLGNSEPRV